MKRWCLAHKAALLLTLIGTGLAPASPSSAEEQLVTIPVVARPTEGANETRWESRIRIIRTGESDVSIRRVWVALPDGGFIDDPAAAPTWELLAPKAVITLYGEDLLTGTTSDIGAVQLAIDGAAHVLERIANTANAPPPDITLGTLTLIGPGQIVPAVITPLSGPSFIPWVNHPGLFRHNIGIVNPNQNRMELEVSTVAVFQDEINRVSLPMPVTLPPLGFVQLNRVLRQLWIQGELTGLEQVFIISIVPEDDRPYHAYGSLVSLNENDPQLVAPVAGSLPLPR